MMMVPHLVWQKPYSEQQGAQSGQPSGHARLSEAARKGGAGQLPRPSPAPGDTLGIVTHFGNIGFKLNFIDLIQ